MVTKEAEQLEVILSLNETDKIAKHEHEYKVRAYQTALKFLDLISICCVQVPFSAPSLSQIPEPLL